jgi:hypothetical protein
MQATEEKSANIKLIVIDGYWQSFDIQCFSGRLMQTRVISRISFLLLWRTQTIENTMTYYYITAAISPKMRIPRYAA